MAFRAINAFRTTQISPSMSDEDVVFVETRKSYEVYIKEQLLDPKRWPNSDLFSPPNALDAAYNSFIGFYETNVHNIVKAELKSRH
jgi:hypothetical protein